MSHRASYHVMCKLVVKPQNNVDYLCGGGMRTGPLGIILSSCPQISPFSILPKSKPNFCPLFNLT